MVGSHEIMVYFGYILVYSEYIYDWKKILLKQTRKVQDASSERPESALPELRLPVLVPLGLLCVTSVQAAQRMQGTKSREHLCWVATKRNQLQLGKIGVFYNEIQYVLFACRWE
jgi:hypothetical protein